MIPEDLRGMLDNGDCQLMMVTFEEGNGSDRTLKAVDEIKSLMNSQMFLGGLAAVINDTKMLIEQELPLYVAVAVGLSLVVLFLGLRYSVAPFIFLLGILYAVLYNFGTNIFLGEVSYITSALERGATGCLTARVRTDYREDKFYIQVGNTERALRDLAAWYKDRFQIPFVGITGSVGKTTAKNMIAAVLSVKYKVLKTEGNFNNNIGLPLTLLRLDHTHQVGVLEMGMDKPGEIDYLSDIVRPEVGVITNIGGRPHRAPGQPGEHLPGQVRAAAPHPARRAGGAQRG